ncbi:hypothetical protein [Desulfoluna butyratoxydans]|uniref:LysM domain-containing protein n=1 Tax=Desulfoluna butyratoxydans TaxID=231438 RepID=A0A4U8YQ18_9BACT|nr:hypothetical protein [Desulfoluna butyratoxydans]VFQ46326.1 hypothetical protein MSL71_39900 [Desulfoluna butyratoxydans]
MFFKHSRYKNQETEVGPDARGRKLSSVSLRLTPVTTGTVRHTLTDADRLDHLSWTCYRTPQLWWHIADANPEFLSPLELMGDGPFRTVRIPMGSGNTAPPPGRSDLLRRLTALPGVEDVLMDETGEPLPTEAADAPEATLIICYNRLTTSPEELVAAVTEAGWIAGTAQPVERTGKSIALADL